MVIVFEYYNISNIIFHFAKLTKQLQEQVKSQDADLIEERNKNLTNIVKTVTKKKKSNKKIAKVTTNDNVEETVVCSEYVKMVQEKKNRNKRKLQDLRLIKKTPMPKQNDLGKERTNLKEVEVNTTARRKVMQSPEVATKVKPKKPGRKKKTVCSFDHKMYGTNYCEESDKRYLLKENDLHDVKCQNCKKCFSVDGEKNSIVPTLKEPIYVCRGRQKHNCTFSFCYSCFQQRFLDNTSGKRARRGNK